MRLNMRKTIFFIVVLCCTQNVFAWHEEYFESYEIKKVKSGENIAFSAWFIGMFKNNQNEAIIEMAKKLLSGKINYALLHRISTWENKQLALAVLTFGGELFKLLGEDEEAQAEMLTLVQEFSWHQARDHLRCYTKNVGKLFREDMTEEDKAKVTLDLLKAGKRIDPIMDIDEITPYCDEICKQNGGEVTDPEEGSVPCPTGFMDFEGPSVDWCW